MTWIRLNPKIRTSAESLELTDAEFREAFNTALEGKAGALSEFVQLCPPPGFEPEYRREWRSLSRVLSPIVQLRDGYKCTYCGSMTNLSIDHIHPLLHGGSNELENLTTACQSCNSSKSSKSLEEWVEMKWFRLYSEARNDAKLRSLSDAHHRVWFNLLCYASEMEERGCIHSVDRELLAVECSGADTDLLDEVITKLAKLRIVTAEQENVCFVNFMKRQYDKPSDTPERVSERVNRHRSKAETPPIESVTPSNAGVTPEKRIYSDTETENTQNTPSECEEAPAQAKSAPKPIKTLPKHNPEAFEATWQAYPKRENRTDAVIAWDALKLDAETVDAILDFIARAKLTDRWKKNMVKPLTFFLRKRLWTDDLSGYADGLFSSSSGSARSSPLKPSHPDTFQGVISDTARALREGGASDH